MALSKRERIISIVTLACVGVLVVNKLVIDTVYGELKRLGEERQDLQVQVEDAENLLARQDALEARWNDLLANGMRDADTAGAVLRTSLRDWANSAGLSLDSQRPEHSSADQGMRELRYTLAAQGTLDAVAHFLYAIETSPVPVKISSMSLGSPEDDGSLIKLQMYLSILYVDPTSEQSQPLFSEANDEYDI